jgi:heme A synthase
MPANRFARYAWFVLGYNLFVILWGAFVRATGSGAGCGSHWPLCNGVVVPRAPQIETIIEFTHRLTSGLSLVLVVILVVWGFRAFAKGHPMRKAVVAVFAFEMVEVLVGAGLVLLGLVAHNDSLARAFVMPIHLVNTFLLLGSTALVAWWAGGHTPFRLRGQGLLAAAWLAGLIGVAIIGMSGALTALGDTLFPSQSLVEGLRQDFDTGAHMLIRLRVWHPVIAVAISLLIVFYLAPAMAVRQPGRATRRISRLLMAFTALQLLAGFVNVVLLAPIWLQILHLALAAAVWVALVQLGAAALERPTADR